MSAPFLTVAQVAERLQVNHKTVRKAIRLGQLEAACIFGQWRVSPEALADFVTDSTPIVQIQKRRRSA